MRNAIYTEVRSIEPFDQLEAEHRSEVLAWIEGGAELCRIEKPATPPKHLVSYFVVVDGADILLVEHRAAGLWLPTGGHVEPGEHPRETVRREAKEELGIEAIFMFDEPLLITSTVTVGTTAGHTDISLWYVLHGKREEELEFDRGEFKSIKWFGRHEIPHAQSDPHLGRFITKLDHAVGRMKS